LRCAPVGGNMELRGVEEPIGRRRGGVHQAHRIDHASELQVHGS